MLRPLGFKRSPSSQQLELALATPVPLVPAAVVDDDALARGLLDRLRAHGLRGIASCTLTTNRSTVVSFRADRLRVHRALLAAPAAVLEAVAHFVSGRGQVRRRARRVLRSFELPRDAAESTAHRPRPPSHPDDAPLLARLHAAHAQLNGERFAGLLGSVSIRVSRRMRSRLGHYSPGGIAAPEIAIARRHLRRDPWDDVVDTLVHEMVHQWQHETARPVAHDRDFRVKARAVGIAPGAKRPAAVTRRRPR